MKQKLGNQSYLERISFDPKLLTGMIAGYISNIRIVILLTISIALLGLVSYFNLPQRLNPEIHIPIVSVVTILPGAGPNDVEKLVTVPLEDKLRGVSGLDTITSVSQENVSLISLQFVNSVTSEKARNDTKEAVDAVASLPEEAQDPTVAAVDFENQPVWQFALTSAGDPVSLFTFSKKLEDIIEDIPQVDHVAVRGRERQIIAVDISPEKAAEYGVNPFSLSSLLTSFVASYPAGSVITDKNLYSLKIDALTSSVEDIRNTLLTVNGNQVKLGDIAYVHERAAGVEAQSYIGTADTESKQAITFAVYKRSTADIVKTATLVRTMVNQAVKDTGQGYEVHSILNTGDQIQIQFSDLLGEFKSTILLVFVTLFLFLGLRQAIISSITVPLTFLSAFIIMRYIGMSINFLSLFAFLLSLGLLIDDTIVVVSAMSTYYKTGKFSPFETGLLVWRDTIIPIWSTTITTIWSFIPLLLSSGIIGEFIKPIPIVVTATMISSTAISVLVTLPLMIILLKPNIAPRVVVLLKIIGVLLFVIFLVSIIRENRFFLQILLLYLLVAFFYVRLRRRVARDVRARMGNIPVVTNVSRLIGRYASHGVINVDGFANRYERFITRILNSPRARKQVLIAIISYSLISFLLLPFGLVKSEFFPKSDADVVYVTTELPSGTTLERNTQTSRELLEEMRKVSGVEFVVADLGTTINTQMGNVSDQGNSTLFTFHLPDKEKRKVSSVEVANELREKGKNFTMGKFSVIEETGGPPAGSDVQLKLSGDDLSVLNSYTDQIVSYLASQPGTENIEKSTKPGTSAIVFVPDTKKLAENNIRIDTLGLWLRTAVSGFTLDTVSFDSDSADKKDIVFSFGIDKQSPESITRLAIPTNTGSLPLSALGHFQIQTNPTLITREDGKRTISVSAGVKRTFNAADINKKLLDYSKTIKLPSGYAWQTGGVNEENEKSVQSIFQAMIVSFLLILVTMVIQFRSYRQAVIVLLVIPLAVSSVFFVFALTGTPLSFPALIGVLSLFGIVVTNSMFIVDKINLNIREGMPFVRALADAGGSRMEPIILTKLCTMFGLLPVTIADPLWRGLGGAIIAGILFASSIMLLFIPVVYYYWMKPEDNSNPKS